MKTTAMSDRQQAMLRDALGPLLPLLADPRTTEICVNPDSTIWHERHGAAMECVGMQDPRTTEAIIRLVATLNQTQVTFTRPSLDAVLPTGERFKGFLPPRTTAPAFCIRVPQARVLTRDDYVPACCTAEVWAVLAEAVVARQNIILCGGMSSGKSTLMNALIQLIPAHLRVATLEDTAELAISVPNHLQLYTAEDSLQAVVKEGFRTAAHRILVGEIRDGVTAINTLKVWLGVGGGMCTTHADSARDALTRWEYLCAEISPGEYGPLLGDVIDLIVFLEQVEGHRRITEMLRVKNWKDGQYDLETVLERDSNVGAGSSGLE